MSMLDILNEHDTHLRQLLNAIDQIIAADKALIEVIAQARPLRIEMSAWDTMMVAAHQHDNAKDLIFEAVSLMRDDFGKIVTEIGRHK